MKNYKELIKGITREDFEKGLVNLHIHSRYSDGKATFKDLVEQAKAKGLKYFAITDNSGKYAIKNIKPNYYAIAALKDLNLNFIYDQVSEKIGFKNENIIFANKNRRKYMKKNIYKNLSVYRAL